MKRTIGTSIAALVLGTLISGCGLSSSENRSTTSSGPPGLGPNPGQPTGTASSLPKSISIISVVGASHTDNTRSTPQCGDPNAERIADNEADGMVDLCVTFQNELLPEEDATVVTQVTLPAASIFVAKSSADPAILKSQNGFVAQAATISIPEGQTKTVILRTFCINKGLPSSDRPELPNNWEYQLTPVQTDVAALIEISTILADRMILWENAMTVQYAIWNVTETNSPLSAADRANLQGLPPKSP